MVNLLSSVFAWPGYINDLLTTMREGEREKKTFTSSDKVEELRERNCITWPSSLSVLIQHELEVLTQLPLDISRVRSSPHNSRK